MRYLAIVIVVAALGAVAWLAYRNQQLQRAIEQQRVAFESTQPDLDAPEPQQAPPEATPEVEALRQQVA